MESLAIIRQKLVGAALIVCTFGGGAVAWATIAPIEGAVIASGGIKLESNVRKIQSSIQGVVAEIHVREGDRVASGLPLVSLDSRSALAGVRVITSDLVAYQLRLARLQAERDSRPRLVVQSEFTVLARDDRQLADAIDAEQSFLSARATTREGQKSQLRERLRQGQAEIASFNEQIEWLDKQRISQVGEVDRASSLAQKGHGTEKNKELAEREMFRLGERMAEARAKIAQVEGRLRETDAQILQIDRDLQTEVSKDIREAETEIAKLRERRIAAEDYLQRHEIKAPVTGRVHQLLVHTTGAGAVNPTETLMELVPDSDALIVEARVAPTDIDQLLPNQETRVRFSNFSQRATPEVLGRVFRIGGDVVREQQTGATYYNVGIRIDRREIDAMQRRLEQASPGIEFKLLPGMPAEVFIKTQARTFASYLLKPLTDNLQRVGRGD